MKRRKQILALVLAGVTVLGMSSVTALAGEDGTTAAYETETASITGEAEDTSDAEETELPLADMSLLSGDSETTDDAEKTNVTEMAAESEVTGTAPESSAESGGNADSITVEAEDSMVTLLTGGGSLEEGQCGDNVYYVLMDWGELYIYGTGEMYDYDGRGILEDSSLYEEVEKVTIGEGDVGLVNSQNITESNVTKIGNNAFDGCYNVTKIDMGDSVTEIGSDAFDGCYNLEDIIIPDSVKTIGAYAFGYCTALENVTIGNSVTDIGEGAFATCVSLKGIVIPNNVSSIEYRAFENCGALASVELSTGITSIEYNTFYNCNSLKEITIPAQVTKIVGGAFGRCTSLENVRLAGNAPSFDEYTETGYDWETDQDIELTYNAFDSVTADVYFPHGNETYTSENMLDYGGKLTWMSGNEEANLYIIYDITDNVYVVGSGTDAIIHCTGDVGDFVSLEMDGVIVDASNYTLADGSTIITLLSSYLDTLSVGKHVVTLNYTYGSVDTDLTIIDDGNSSNNQEQQNTQEANGQQNTQATNTQASQTSSSNTTVAKAAKTGDTGNVFVWIVAVMAAGAVFAGVAATRRKRY